MRIAHVVSTFAPQLGGMGTVCASEARSLAAAGHEVTVFTLQYPGEIDAQHDQRLPFTVVRLKPIIKFGDAGLVPQLAWRINKNFDLVHLHYPFYGGAEWLWFLKTPLVITCHMDAQVSGLKLLIQKLYNVVWPDRLFSKAKKIITIDKYFTNFVTDFYKNKTEAIANGVDANIFKPMVPDFDGLGLAGIKDKKVILFVGNLLPLKRLDLLIKALGLLQDTGVVLLVVGEGEKFNESQRLVKDLGLDSQVRFVGPRYNISELARYYALARCVAVPSDYESFSLVAIEAMACGKPVVLADLPESKQRFDQAIFFEKGSVESLKNALEKILLLSEAEKNKIEEQGIKKVKKEFSWENHMAALEDLYKKVVSAQGL